MRSSLKNNPNGRLIWRLHRVVEPVQVLSLRVTQGYFADAEPRFGNRLLAHALVKFDTEQVCVFFSFWFFLFLVLIFFFLQSLEIYDHRGRPLHPAAPTEKENTSGAVKGGAEKWRVPAVPKRVQEYLVLEKRMWVPGPWVFREQMWPTWPLEEEAEVSGEL